VIRGVRWVARIGAIAAGALACQEHLTSPGQCPELCPGGSPTVYDTVLSPVQGRNESVSGYVARGGGTALLTSNGLPASEDRAIYKFVSRQDSVTVRDTSRAYTVDSVTLGVTLVARDTLVNGLKIFLYRLPADINPDTATFAGIDPELAPAALVDSIIVPDSVNTGALSVILRGPDLDRVAIPAGTGGVLALGLRISADSPTGIRTGTIVGGNAATFISYVTVDVPDTTTAIKHQVLSRSTQFNGFVTQTPYTAQPGTLLIGGEPSSRGFIRFELPSRIKDSATVVRATLELLPVAPIPGLPTDPAILFGRAVLSDLGPKSPLATTPATLISQDTLPLASTDTIRIDVTAMVQLWQESTERPQEVVLQLGAKSLTPGQIAEASSFTRLLLGSTSPLSPAGPPRLRVTYLLPFPFESP
jgi:hypothetical protein